MPPRKFSRHSYTLAVEDEAAPGVLQLTERNPFPYKELADNRQHVVRQGDTLHTLAARYFKGVDRPAQLWWVIADFQPDPIHDPTLELALGRVIVVPSLRTVIELVFSETRRAESVQ